MPTNKAYTKRNRTNRGTPLDEAAIASYQANPYSGGQKNLAVGPEHCKQDANAFVSGRDVSGASEPVSPGSILYIYNNSATVGWISLSTDSAIATPTGFANGIPLKPNDWTILSAGENNFIRSGANTVALYEPKDDTVPRDEA